MKLKQDRALAGATSAANSVVSGSGIAASIEAFKTYTVTVTARDASNNNVGHGGDIFYIQIKNKCTIDVYGVCTAVAGSKSTLSAPIKGVMNDNGDGTYSFNYSVSFDGAVTVIVELLTQGGLKVQWFPNLTYTPPTIKSNITSNINFFWDVGYPDFIPGLNYYFTAKFFAKLRPPTSETYSFFFKQDDGANLSIDDNVILNRVGVLCVCTNTFTQSFTANTFYDLKIDFYQGPLAFGYELYWSTPTISQVIVPSSSYYYADLAGSSVNQVAVVCPTGYYGNLASSPTSCATLCGDGIKVGSETCDDSNTIDGDGCQANCGIITTGFVCSGGGITAKDTCIQCTIGFYPNTNNNQCITRCGDGLKAGSEICDDGNTVDGDGCQANCGVVTTGFVCSGGSITAKDTCIQCTSGFYPNADNNQCVTRCGDGLKAGSETCDDGNTVDGDGCQANCGIITTGFVCSGGSITAKDTCIQCTIGFYPNTNNNQCVTRCGDGIKAGSETCDDGNTVDGDGCQANCGIITTGFVCSGGSIATKDTCIQCTRGFYPNTNNNQCVTRCGDGLKAGSEGCDDGNSSNGDGCSSSCVVEDGYKCSGGSLYSTDTCVKCSRGFYTNYSNTSQCITKVGDGIRAGDEQCDDGNIKDGDGCSSQAKIEDGYACVGGEFGLTDVCVQCDLGYDPNPDYSVCVGSVVPLDAKSVAVASVIAAFVGVASNAILAAMTSTSSGSSNSFGMMNQLQLVIIIPMLKTYLPEKIYNYLKSMSTSLFNINFLPTSDSSSFIDFQAMFDYNQQDSYLKLLGLTSGSAFVNILNLMTTVGCIVCIHIIVFILFLIARKLTRLRWIKNLLIKLLEMLTFGFYITVYIESYILFILVDFNEINFQNKKGIKNMKSCVMSYIILGIMILFIILTLWQWIKSRKTEVLENLKYFKVLVDGMKPKWICRSYFLVFLIRRTLFGIILFFLESYSMIMRVILFVVVQFLITVYMIVLRPQQELKEQISDVINEVYFLFFGAFLLYFNTEDRWSSTPSEAYFWILMSNNFVLIFIMLVSSMIAYFKLIKKLVKCK